MIIIINIFKIKKKNFFLFDHVIKKKKNNNNNNNKVTLTTVQKKYYRAILEKNLTWLKKGTKKNNMPNLVNTMIELRKCCIHPFLIKGAEDRILKEDNAITPEQQFKSMINASGKLVLTDKLLHKLHKGGSKVLIFSQMTQCLDILADYLTGRNWKYERIDVIYFI